MNEQSKRFVWIDLEMTGLNPDKDVILEIATIVTDGQLNIIAQGPDIVIHQSESLLNGMDEWCTRTHTKTGLCEKVKASDTSVGQAETQTLAFLREHCEEKKCQLAGNSVWMDRFFIMRYMPRLYDFLHYRTIDVSTVKELVCTWCPEDENLKFSKKNTHRALEDIKESIEELKHYREYFFKKCA